MKRTSFSDWHCSIAQTVEIIGEVWTPLILRDLFWGVDRYEDLLDDLGISRNILSDRLRTLQEHGIVDKVPYQNRPVRHRYQLTPKGTELWPLLAAMLAWGDRWTTGDEGPPVLLRHDDCGETFHAVPTCSACGGELAVDRIHFDLQGSSRTA